MNKITIITNNKPRDIIQDYELTDKEKEEFDFLDWDELDAGHNSAEFIRYKGALYYLGDFVITPKEGEFSKWDGVAHDSYFSGVLIKYCNNYEQVIVGRYYC